MAQPVVIGETIKNEMQILGNLASVALQLSKDSLDPD